MPDIDLDAPGKTILMMGNEAIARGALEAGVGFASSYPGTPSSEILPSMAAVAKRMDIYAEWSVNEMVAMMNATGASLAGIRAMASMKPNGTNVALDFISCLTQRGLRQGGGLVIVNCDDPGGRTSPNEVDSRSVAKWLDIPLIEPGDFQEAKDMMKWLYDLSEELDTVCMLRSVAKIAHGRGNVTLGELPGKKIKPAFDFDKTFSQINPHAALHEKLDRAKEKFEKSPFNWYVGPEKADLLIITCGACWLYTKEAIRVLDLEKRVGILKLGTTWPLPDKLVADALTKSQEVLIVEDIDPIVERSIMELSANLPVDAPRNIFYGKRSGHITAYGEQNPDTVINAVSRILDLPARNQNQAYGEKMGDLSSGEIIARSGAFCAGCPHRASHWAIKNALELDGREGFACTDNGCMGTGQGPTGYYVGKTMYSMGSSSGVADGLGKLGALGLEQPVVAIQGDSTFYHSGMPSLLNAVWNKSNFTLIVLDNSATAMTGFQPHPGTGRNALGDDAQKTPIEDICRVLGARVEICDPFEIDATISTLLDTVNDEKSGPRVVIMRRQCELIRARGADDPFKVYVDQDKCLGESCGCNLMCSRVFLCPGLKFNRETGRSEIDEIICCGCGVCADVCPEGAIIAEEFGVADGKSATQEVLK
jgi:indolepyruvate ferredoxin oxidoreductase, alpha subunit